LWQDGSNLTADDVLFTYQTIQNPDAGSPLQSAWHGIKITETNKHTIVFTLPNALTAFPHSLTNGIVPAHLLKNIPVSELRSASFNTSNPVGAGPFSWETIQVQGDLPEQRTEDIGLVANLHYYQGPPKIERFVVHTYYDEKHMINSFNADDINAMAGLSSLPDNLKNSQSVYDYNIPLTSETMVFFKTTGGALGDVKVRQALVQAVNVPKIVNGMGHMVIMANEPLLQSQLGYQKDSTQLPVNIDVANKLLDAAGWTQKNKNGILTICLLYI